MATVRITSEIVYTIHDTTTGEKFKVEGIKGLDQYVENVVGGLVDRIVSAQENLPTYKRKLPVFEYIMANRKEFGQVLELLDLVDEIKNPKDDEDEISEW